MVPPCGPNATVLNADGGPLAQHMTGVSYAASGSTDLPPLSAKDLDKILAGDFAEEVTNQEYQQDIQDINDLLQKDLLKNTARNLEYTILIY
jgi:hypothetical protein